MNKMKTGSDLDVNSELKNLEKMIVRTTFLKIRIELMAEDYLM